jgi:drug/metabolite transporter (DMT)-like permease
MVAITGSFSFSILMIYTRQVRGTSDIVLVTTQMVGALLAGAVLAPLTWVPLTWFDGALLVVLGVVATVAHFCVNRALKLAPASVVVPYQYTMIVWAIILGYMFFGDIPRTTMVAGAAIIIAAGIYIFVREQIWQTPTSFADPP